MKKWTVMLIPHDRGDSRTYTWSSLYSWAVFAVLAGLVFTSAFFYQRHQATLAHAGQLRELNQALKEQQFAAPPTAEPAAKSAEENPRDVEARIRAEYEATIAAITAELSTLYTMETRARSITGLAPRAVKALDDASQDIGDGRGGAPGVAGLTAYTSMLEVMRPPHLIHGMSRPSADLIMQEIRLRTQSLSELVDDMEAEIDRIERVPAAWPLAENAGRITSRFGYRRDPFHRRVRHHDGTDIAARPGTPILAAGKGRVITSEYDAYLGHMIRIDHGNGIVTLYAHMLRRIAEEGDLVEREQEIGRVGSTGRSTGPHLHFEVHVDGKTVDPEKYISE